MMTKLIKNSVIALVVAALACPPALASVRSNGTPPADGDVALSIVTAYVACTQTTTGPDGQLVVALNRDLTEAEIEAAAAAADANRISLVLVGVGQDLRRSVTVSNATARNAVVRMKLDRADLAKIAADATDFRILARLPQKTAGVIKAVSSVAEIKVPSACEALSGKLPKPPLTNPPDPFPTDLIAFVGKPKEPEASEVTHLKATFSYDGSTRDKKYSNVELNYDSGHKDFFVASRRVDFQPATLEIKYSNNTAAQPGVINAYTRIGFNGFLRNSRGNDGGNRLRNIYNGLETTAKAGIEANVTASSVNTIFGLEMAMPLNFIQNRWVNASFRPFSGLALGYAARREKQDADAPPVPTPPGGAPRAIRRPYFGFDFKASPTVSETSKRGFQFDVNYKRHLFLTPEPVFEVKDPDAKAVKTGYNTSPLDYVRAKFTLMPDSIFAPFVQYTWGYEPPQYILIRNRIQAGLEIKWYFKR